MNEWQYRAYTQEFKLAAQLELELGITKGLLLKWRDRYQVKQKAGRTWRRCWTCLPAPSSVGQWPSTCARWWSRTRSRWQWAAAACSRPAAPL